MTEPGLAAQGGPAGSAGGEPLPPPGGASPFGRRIGRALPYFVVLAIVCGLYVLAGRIDFAAPGGRIGPNFWPKAILLLAMATCVYAIAKTLLFGRGDRDVEGVLGSVLKEVPAADEATLTADAPEPRYPLLLWSGIALTVGYLFAVEKLGFFLTTALYLGIFMWIGRYRRVGVIVATSLLGSLFFVFMFMKVVYVSLPLGQEPFSQVTFALMRLMGIR
jgi:putative tricarboxylic transport membrane protein